MRCAFALSFLLLAASAAAQWANACGDGRVDRVIDAFDSLSGWTYCCSDREMSPASLTLVAGCSGQAMRIDYNLAATGSWCSARCRRRTSRLIRISGWPCAARTSMLTMTSRSS
jgi:hypothetical protein